MTIKNNERYKRISDCSTTTQLLLLHSLERKYPQDLEYLLPCETLLDEYKDISVDSLNKTHNLGIIFSN